MIAAAIASMVAFAAAGSASPVSTKAATVTESKLTAAAGQTGDAFGTSVSIDGDTAIVGAPLDDTAAGPDAGSASVFVRTGGTWSLQQEVTAPDGAAGDEFGSAVAVSGDTVIIGARGDTSGLDGAGSAYVFLRTGTTWSLQQKLTASDAGRFDRLGYSVALEGDTAVVGAFADNTSAGADAGSAYVFVRSGGTWSQQQKLTAGDGQASALFGSSVGIRGDTAAVGAYAHDGLAGANQGAEYVFMRSAGTWSQHQKLTSSGAEANQFFGAGTGFDGTTLVVGAPGDDSTAGTDSGLAYVFGLDAGTWTERQALGAPEPASGDQFGTSVAVDGARLVAGAPLDDTSGGSDAGAAYSFSLESTWIAEAALTASDGAAGDRLGVSAAVGGDTALAGANGDDTAGGADAGSASAFRIQTGVGCVRTGSTLSIDIPAGGSVTIGRSGTSFNLVGSGISDSTCGGATVDNVDTVVVTGANATELVGLDLSGGPFAPGATPEGTGISEIEFQLDLGAGNDTLVVQGGILNEKIRLGSAGINWNGDGDADVMLTAVQTVTVNGGDGSDTISGSGGLGTGGLFQLPLTQNGDAGGDRLRGGAAGDVQNGGTGNDTLFASNGADLHNGGGGKDTTNYAARAGGVVVILDGLGNDGGSGGAEGDNVDTENVVGGKGDDSLDGGASVTSNTFTGGRGSDSLFGREGNDNLKAQDGISGNDTADGGNGTDSCVVDPGDTVLNCP